MHIEIDLERLLKEKHKSIMIGTDGNHLSVSKRSIKGLASAAKMVIPQKIKIAQTLIYFR